MAALLLLGMGCGLELAESDAADTDAADTDETANGGTEDTGAPLDGGTSTGFPQTGTGLDGTDTDRGGSTSGDEPDDTGGGENACDLDCGDNGSCEDFGDGPTCVCEKGSVSTGLDCLACETVTNGDLPADIPAVNARFSFTVAGGEPPTSPVKMGAVFLRNPRTLDLVKLGRTSDANASMLVVPGTYEVIYSHRQGSEGVPANSGAKISTLDIQDDGTEHVIDIPLATVSGSFTIDGRALSDSAVNYGRVWLVNQNTGDRALLGDTRSDTFVADVIPGAYEIRYEARESTGSAPLNTDGFVGYVEVAPAHEVIQELPIDIPVTHYAGQLLINNAPVPSSTESAVIELHDLATGASFRLGRTQDTEFDVALLPGRYEVVYKSAQGGAIAPVNTHHVLETIEIKQGNETHDINVPTTPFGGTFTLGGDVPPASNSDDGVVLLRSVGGVDSAVLGNTRDGTFERQIIPGDYQAFYSQETAGGVMPGNTNAGLEGVIAVPEDGTFDAAIDIPVIELTGVLTIGGGEAPDSPYDDGRLYLRNAETGDSVLLGNTRLGAYVARVVPGTYDIVYEAEFSDGVMPVNRGAVVDAGVALTVGGERNIDIEVTSLTGDITVAGSASDSVEGLGQLYLRDVVGNDLVFLGHTGAPGFQQPLLGGRYIAEYHGVAGDGETLGLTLPANERASFACFDIAAE